ncbi:MAG: hypothetical protein ACRDNS_08860 [Trebonia sp.]
MRRGAEVALLLVASIVLFPCGAAQADDASLPSPTVQFLPQGVSYQSWTVPEGVEAITLYVDGGAGGNGDVGGGTGGRGGAMRGTFAVTPGDTLNILVGNNGPNGYSAGSGSSAVYYGGGGSDGGYLGTWPGGAAGLDGNNGTNEEYMNQPVPTIGGGGAGGGASEVILNHDGTQSVLLVAPGGGGGGGSGGNGGDAGGDGSSGTGGAGGKAPVNNTPGVNGSGVAGPAGATGPSGLYTGQGGQDFDQTGGGGGGGGWYGGGGGAGNGRGGAGGGGGGSSYVSPSAMDTLVVINHGQLSDSGEVSIGYNTSSESPEPEADLLEPLPVIHGTAIVGRTLTCTQGEDTAPQFTISFQWLRNGKPIAGAGTDAYKVTSADVGHKLQCQVTASDAAGSKAGVSKFVVVPPVVTLGAASVKGTGASVKVTCKARTGVCMLTGVLTIVQKHKTVTIGKAALKLKRGKHGTLSVKLSHAGLKLRKHGRKLKATLTLLETTTAGTKVTLQTKTVGFAA